MDNALRELLLSGIANRQTIIHFPNGEYPDITHGFYSGSLKLEEILCSTEQLTFGECNASKFEATIAGVDDISNLIIKVYQQIHFDESKTTILLDYDDVPILTEAGEYILLGRNKDYIIPLFYGRVDSAKLQTDRIHREIIAYDELYFQGDTNCADWYAEFFEGTGDKSLKTFRDSLFKFIGIEQEKTTLINDDIVLEETMQTTSLKFSDLIKAICQINGCFGQVDRNGVFRYIYLNNSVENYDISDNYRSNDSTFESYVVKKIDKLQINSEEGDLGAVVGTGNNSCIIQGNFLIWGKGAAELQAIATKLLNAIKDIEYRPFSADLIYSEPYITVGNSLTLATKRDGVKVVSYVFKNEMDFAQLMHQTLSSEGSEYRDEVVDDVNAEINQLRGKTIKIAKDVDNFSVTLEDLQKGYSEIKQTADQISLTVTGLEKEYSSIVQTVDNITLEVKDKVDVGDVSTQLSLEKDQIRITGERLVIETTKFNLSADGAVTCSDMNITGGSIKVESTTSENFIELMNPNTHRGFSLSQRGFFVGDDYSYLEADYGKIHCISGDYEYEILPTRFSMKYNGREFFMASNSEINICPVNSAYLGFFGQGSATQQWVPQLDSDSDTSEIIKKINQIIESLQNYGLFSMF